MLGPRSVTEFNYRFAGGNDAHIFVGVEIAQKREIRELTREFKRAGMVAFDLTENEMAKLHLRHLVGGHAPGAQGERLFRFDFPERPGALANFLRVMHSGWNITLFHYRNHGSDVGRVLAGIQVPKRENAKLDEFLRRIAQMGYTWVEETENIAYKLFLGMNQTGSKSRHHAP